MKETNISDEMLSRFLEGRTDEAEDARLLQAMEEDGMTADDLAAIAEAAKLADTVPQQTPNLILAKKQIENNLMSENRETVPTLRRSKTRTVWAIAASVAVLLAVALFLLFRPDSSDQNFAQQEGNRIEEVAKEKEDKSQTNGKTATDKTEKVRHGEKSPMNDTEDDHSEPTELQPAPITSQKLEKNYAATKTANTLTVTKPIKENYRVLCKNLEKSLQFEWSATNVQKLHFTVTNAQGKVLGELTDKTAMHMALPYSKIYPEQQLRWTLKVLFEDGTNETKSGQIEIDYNLQN